jgi:hypothetical protein
MPNCQTCGVAMGASERTRNRQGVAGNWHNDCELLEHIELFTIQAAHKVNVTASKNKLVNRHVSTAARPTTQPAGTASVSGGAMSVGNYLYVYTSVSIDGESLPSPASAAITTAGANLKTAMTAIAVGVTGTLTRNLYRTLVNATGPFYFVTNIADNATTTYADLLSDATILATNRKAPEFTTFTVGEFP